MGVVQQCLTLYNPMSSENSIPFGALRPTLVYSEIALHFQFVGSHSFALHRWG